MSIWRKKKQQIGEGVAEKDKEIVVCPFCGKCWEKPKKVGHVLLRILIEALIWTAGTTVTLLIFKFLGL